MLIMLKAIPQAPRIPKPLLQASCAPPSSILWLTSLNAGETLIVHKQSSTSQSTVFV